MSSKISHCIVDDTALITNIGEIEQWISHGSITLVIPLHTIERLHLLKKDTSQIGQNARKAVKFLDEVTSDPKLASAIILQESDERYETWSEVEAHYVENGQAHGESPGILNQQPILQGANSETSPLVQTVIEKNTTPKRLATSPASTPPLSPTSSGPQSSKTSPEAVNATIASDERSLVPPSLKDLLNSVVWYTFEKSKEDLIFLTNSSDTSYLARDFGVTSKNIHQLRASIGLEHQEAVDRTQHQKKQSTKSDTVLRTLFRYEDEESEDEELIFQPRGRGVSRGSAPRSSITVQVKNGHSPANSLSAQLPSKPQIPIEEIDPDSFDRGSFGRGNTTLAIVGNHTRHQAQPGRGSLSRGTSTVGGQSRGNHRGSRGQPSDRGFQRGRGRLFVP